MAHNSLVPEDDVYLENDDIVRLLGEEFSFVETNQKLGEQEYDKGLDYLRSLLEQELSPGGRDIKQELEAAESKRDKSLHIFIADSPEPGDAYLCTTLVPEEPIFFGYCSHAHQEASQPLLERVKKALGYHDYE